MLKYRTPTRRASGSYSACIVVSAALISPVTTSHLRGLFKSTCTGSDSQVADGVMAGRLQFMLPLLSITKSNSTTSSQPSSTVSTKLPGSKYCSGGATWPEPPEPPVEPPPLPLVPLLAPTASVESGSQPHATESAIEPMVMSRSRGDVLSMVFLLSLKGRAAPPGTRP